MDTTGATSIVIVNNDVTTDGGQQSSGSGSVTPTGGEVHVHKNVQNINIANREITWSISFNVPADGLTTAEVKDTYPSRWINGSQVVENLIEGSVNVTGLVDGETYVVEPDVVESGIVFAKITFSEMNRSYPRATSSAIIRLNPAAKATTPILECLPADISGISSSTTT